MKTCVDNVKFLQNETRGEKSYLNFFDRCFGVGVQVCLLLGECRILLEFLIFVTLEVVRMKMGAKLWVNLEGMTHPEVGHTHFSSSL